MFRQTAKFLYKYLVKTNIFISICAVTFYFSGLLFLRPSTVTFFSSDTLLVFCCTLLIYNLSQSKFGIVHFVRFRSTISIVLFLMTLFPVALLVWELKFHTLLYLGHLGLISLLYNSPLLHKLNYLPLRSIPLVKIFLIAYIWASIGTFLPMLTHGIQINAKAFLLFAAQFFFIMAITLPFDIRDFYSDIRRELKTFPGALGIKNTKRLAYFSLGVHWFLLFIISAGAGWFFAPLVVLIAALIKQSSASKADYYYTFFMDGVIVLQFLIAYLLRT